MSNPAMQIPAALNSRDQILDYARQYDGELAGIKYNTREQELNLGPRMKDAGERGYMTRNDLLAVVTWKAKRAVRHARKNDEARVRKISGASFAAESEPARISGLLELHGIDWPIASLILHFAFPARYPILDTRVLAMLGGSTYYTPELWVEYTELCRNQAREYDVTLRELDKALWIYTRENS